MEIENEHCEAVRTICERDPGDLNFHILDRHVFIIYVADDQQSPAADERSVPAARTY